MKLRQNPADFVGIPQPTKIVHCSKSWPLESGLSKVPLATYHDPVLPRIFLATAWKALAILSRRHNCPSRRYSWPTTRSHLFAILGGMLWSMFKCFKMPKMSLLFRHLSKLTWNYTITIDPKHFHLKAHHAQAGPKPGRSAQLCNHQLGELLKCTHQTQRS